MLRRIRRFFFSRMCLMLLVATLLVMAFTLPYENAPPIRGDGLGYHIWTYAILRGDFNFAAYADNPAAGVTLADPQRGYYHNKYGPGVAIIRLPVMIFFADSSTPAPAVSSSEQWAARVLSALALLAITFFALRCCRRLGTARWAANLATLAIVFGTGLFNYAAFDAGYSHIWSALGIAFLLDLGVKAFVGHINRLNMISMGVVVVLLILIRNTNVLAVGMLILMVGFGQHRHGVPWPKAIVRRLLPLAGAAALGLAIQIAINSHAHHRLAISSYSEEHFIWDRPMFWSVLTSYNHGVFLYYPILAVIVVGGLICRASRRPTLVFALVLTAYVVLYGYWYSWWLERGFGHRGFVDIAPLGIPILALALSRTRRIVRLLLVVATLASIAVTLEMMAGYWSGSLPPEFISGDTYYSHLYGRESLLGWLH
jgi:hypothetical protein